MITGGFLNSLKNKFNYFLGQAFLGQAALGQQATTEQQPRNRSNRQCVRQATLRTAL